MADPEISIQLIKRYYNKIVLFINVKTDFKFLLMNYFKLEIHAS